MEGGAMELRHLFWGGMGVFDALIHPSIRAEPTEDLRRTQIFVGLSLIFAALAFLATPFSLLINPLPFTALVFVNGLLHLANIALAWSTRSIWLPTILFLAMFSLTGSSALFKGGLEGFFSVMWLLLVPLMGAFLAGLRLSALFLGINILLVSVAALFWAQGFQPTSGPPASQSAVVLVLIFSLVSLLILAIGWLFESSRSLSEHALHKSHIQNHELEVARQVAERSNQAKSEFLANMSHELRTPLNAILGYTALIAEESDDSSMKNSDLKHIQDAGEHLLQLVNDLLDLSKIEAGKMKVAYYQFQLDEFVEGIIASIRPLAQQHENQLSSDISRAPEHFVTDPHKLRQCLLNLLSNATKFTQKGQIKLQIEPHDEWLAFEVSDTGVGIPEDEQEAIFESFAQASTGGHGGTGLGLAITKSLAALLEGDLQLQSIPGEGSTFTLLLPTNQEPTSNLFE